MKTGLGVDVAGTVVVTGGGGLGTVGEFGSHPCGMSFLNSEFVQLNFCNRWPCLVLVQSPKLQLYSPVLKL